MTTSKKRELHEMINDEGTEINIALEPSSQTQDISYLRKIYNQLFNVKENIYWLISVIPHPCYYRQTKLPKYTIVQTNEKLK